MEDPKAYKGCFMVIYDKYRDARWHSVWSRKEGQRDKETIGAIRKEKKNEIDIYIALQYLFQKELDALKDYMNKAKLLLIGDIPIFAAADSADTWSHPELFKRDEMGNFNVVSGVPPDNFSPFGQLWGNPVYDWKKHEKDDFSWWKERIKRTLELCDIIRIDHFRGFAAYYEIKAGETTAEHGVWRKSPGRRFFSLLKKDFGHLPIIAEDLGWLTEDVKKLRDDFGFPGMKITQDGFTFDRNGLNPYDDFLPHNFTRNFIAYTGTHDNDTVKGWYERKSDVEKHLIREYLSTPDDEIVWSLIKAIMLSNADTAIIPMQDILELGSEARMNVPATCNSRNWSWRMRKNAFSDYRIGRFAFLSRISGRNGMCATEYFSASSDGE